MVRASSWTPSEAQWRKQTTTMESVNELRCFAWLLNPCEREGLEVVATQVSDQTVEALKSKARQAKAAKGKPSSGSSGSKATDRAVQEAMDMFA
jgi:hypothetical protein